MNFANPEAEDGATSLEAGVDGDCGDDDGDGVALSESAAPLPLALLSVAAAAAAEGLRMLASGAMPLSHTRVSDKKPRKRGESS